MAQLVSLNDGHRSLISQLSPRTVVSDLALWGHHGGSVTSREREIQHCDVIYVDCSRTRKLARSRSSLVNNNCKYRFLITRFSRPSVQEIYIYIYYIRHGTFQSHVPLCIAEKWDTKYFFFIFLRVFWHNLGLLTSFTWLVLVNYMRQCDTWHDNYNECIIATIQAIIRR